MFFRLHVMARSAPLCLLAALATGIAGCASGGGGQPGDPPAGGETAPQAWDSLKSQAAFGDVLGAVLPQATPAKRLLDNSLTSANTEVAQAMKSPLPIEALDGMVDDVAQKMVKTIPEVPEVKKSKNQLILAFATIRDSTGSDNPSLAQALDSLRDKLSKSEKMTDNFVFVSTTETDASRLNQEIAGKDTHAFRDPLQRTPDNTHPVVYDPAAIFLITGALHDNLDQVHHTVQVRLSLQFDHVQSRRLVENEQFVRTYMWHPKKHSWELQP